MKENSYNLGIREDVSEANSAGIAYIVIPSDVDRDKYIGQCYKTSTVSIYSERNGFSNRVPVDQYTLNFLKFPDKLNKFGSAVSFILEPINKRPIITGIYFKNNELSALQENQFKFKRELEGNVVEINASAANKNIDLVVIADEEGVINLKVSSINQSAKLNIDIDGDVNIQSANNTTIVQGNKFELATVNTEDNTEFTTFNQTTNSHEFHDEKHKIYTNELKINNGEEPFVLGKRLANFLKDFIQEVGSSTVTTSLGQMPLLNSQKILDFQNKVSDLLSTVGFIDK